MCKPCGHIALKVGKGWDRKIGVVALVVVSKEAFHTPFLVQCMLNIIVIDAGIKQAGNLKLGIISKKLIIFQSLRDAGGGKKGMKFMADTEARKFLHDVAHDRLLVSGGTVLARGQKVFNAIKRTASLINATDHRHIVQIVQIDCLLLGIA